jgi:GT2 family glycosyltransferase
MTGLIGVIADYSGRYTWFSQCLADLEKPEGTKIEWRMGANRGAMRNALAQACLDQGRDWILYIDDDQAFPTGTLIRLLAHNQPVVSALIVQRAAPFLPTAYAERGEDGNYLTLDLRSVGHNNLVRVAATGTGGLLVRAEVLRELGSPWFVYSEDFGEDMFFANRLAEAGIPMILDTGCRMGHIAPAAVFPVWNGNAWEAEFKYSDGTSISMPMNHEKGEG